MQYTKFLYMTLKTEYGVQWVRASRGGGIILNNSNFLSSCSKETKCAGMQDTAQYHTSNYSVLVIDQLNAQILVL